MSNRKLYLLAGSLGSLVGGYVPSLWGAGQLSGWSILLGMAGGLAGIWLAHRFMS